jgi:UDPglucose 6-dehydrogenase
MSYKPDTPVIDESQGIMIANQLADLGLAISVSDPQALENAQKVLSSKIQIINNVEAAILEAEVIIITTPWQEYKDVNPKIFDNKTIIDCWRIYDQSKIPNCNVIYLGRSGLVEV